METTALAFLARVREMAAEGGVRPTNKGRRSSRLVERLTRSFQTFIELETASSAVLLAATLVALVWANSEAAPLYESLRHLPVSIGAGSFSLSLSLEGWINDGLMTIFFFVVGMEIKRELVEGELSSRARAMLPVLAAFGGMIVPASIYALFHAGDPASHGWGIPMATDIAFAVAALTVFGKRVPSGLKVFLLALAIADDLGAVAVIAIFYTVHLSLTWLALAVVGVLFAALLQRLGVRSFGVYLLMGVLVWFAMLHSGVHATVAGVMMGFLTPARPLEEEEGTFLWRAVQAVERMRSLRSGQDHGGHERHRAWKDLKAVRWASLSPLDQLTNELHPWVAFVIMPLFALANAGVAFDTRTLSDPLVWRVGLAVALGLLVGKPLGIMLFSYVAVKLRVAALPNGVSWSSLLGAAILGGIGFTVALFVTALAFGDEPVAAGSKVGILAGSALAAVLGTLFLAFVLPRGRSPAAGGS